MADDSKKNQDGVFALTILGLARPIPSARDSK